MQQTLQVVQRRAGFSRCKSYRYWLIREFTQGCGRCVFIGLNPSTGDADNDDPTIRRCMGFAQHWGYRHLSVVNLFAYRTPSPAVLKSSASPEGSGNRAALRKALQGADCIVAAWGTHGTYQNQAARLAGIWAKHPLQCFGQTQNRQPLHPLYQRTDANIGPYLPE